MARLLTRTVVAEPEVLERHGALPIDGGVELYGWKFVSLNDKIANEETTSAFQQAVDGTAAEHGDGGPSLALPEIIFPRNGLLVACGQAGLDLSVSARGALCKWAAGAHGAEDVPKGACPRFCCPHAANAPRARAHRRRFRSPARPPPPPPNPAAVAAAAFWSENAPAPGGVSGVVDEARAEMTAIAQRAAASIPRLNYDWTYYSEYMGDLRTADGGGGAPRGDEWPPAGADDLRARAGLLLEEVEGSAIEWDLLRRRDDILFYDDVAVFEDELHDHGMARCSGKIRVMPNCWFLLLRTWLRVDSIVMKAFETRYFHKFGAAEVAVDTKELRKDWAELAADGRPLGPASYEDENACCAGVLRVVSEGHYVLRLPPQA